MTQYLFKIFSVNRLQRITFVSEAVIEVVLKKAHEKGLTGSFFVTETDGCVIFDDNTLEWYAKEKTTLMLVEKESDWTEARLSITSLLNDSDINALNVSIEADGTPAASILPNIASQSSLQRTTSDELHETAAGSSAEIIPENSTSFNKSNLSKYEHEISIVQTSDMASNCSLDTTLTMSSTATSSRSDSVECTKLFRSFQIPWERIPTDIMESLARKEKIGGNLNRFVNIITDEMRNLSYFLPMNAIRTVCDKIAMKYPESFLECDLNGHILSGTPFSLITTMKNRNNFLNRVPKKRKSGIEACIPIKQQRLANTLMETCANWQPQEINEGQSYNSLELKKNALIKLHEKNFVSQEERETIKDFMKECFPIQRKYFNNMDNIPTIIEIQRNWPFMFNKEYLYDHFELLMNLKANTFIMNFEKNKAKINQIAKNTKEEEGDESTFNAIFGTTMEDIIISIPTNGPWFAIVDTMSEQCIAYIFAEKILIVKEENFTFVDLLCQVISYYYVFNIVYPKEISQSLEFCVRYFYNHYCEKLRGSKKTLEGNNFQYCERTIKILGLVQKLSDELFTEMQQSLIFAKFWMKMKTSVIFRSLERLLKKLLKKQLEISSELKNSYNLMGI
ncbi:uncharacterized protein LOC129611938 [Condylostylus longicornis]|uniref:uncharacterized protein LOC129611938 n=1 Tax=Condylostylus longicornis TaxID=2530218 RepID=UPI00244E161C|nr:uncharacterized protein LOC129611938 [Condylostylus longicornis]